MNSSVGIFVFFKLRPVPGRRSVKLLRTIPERDRTLGKSKVRLKVQSKVQIQSAILALWLEQKQKMSSKIRIYLTNQQLFYFEKQSFFMERRGYRPYFLR